jgi:anaerobic ribonucleoside-triphosphate reductase
MKRKVEKIRKRDGRVARFDPGKITNAIWAAAQSVGGKDKSIAEKLTKEIVKVLERKYDDGGIPSVEHIQDMVEKVLIENGHAKTAKAYILYREQHKNLREVTKLLRDITIVDDYIEELDWRVRENSNMTYSLQGLNVHITSKVISNYWLNSVYPKEIRNAHINGEFHIHDLGTLGPYCVGWDLEDLLLSGFRGVRGKIESKPARHFDVALMQIVNFMYTLQGEAAGAVALSNFDTLLAPFIRVDKMKYEQVKQSMQKFLFNMNVPTRVGFQTPFSNVTLDLTVPGFMRNQPVIVGGKAMDTTYGEYQHEMEMFNRAFAETMLAGDASGRPFTFPIPTYNVTKDFPWDKPEMKPVWEMTAKYGIPYFANFVNSDMKPDDVRSMCPLAGNENVLIRSSRGRGVEYSSIINIYEGNSKRNEYEIFSDGRFVKGRFNKFNNQKMLKLTLDNGHEIRMSEEHLNFVLYNRNSKKIYTIKGKELREGMFLPYSLNTYRGNGGNSELGFFVGAYAGDGSVDRDASVVFSLGEGDKKKTLKRLKQIAEKYFGAGCNVKESGKTGLVTLKVHSKAAVGLCKDFVNGKERDKHYNARLFDMSVDFRKGAIEGHYATDGGNRNRIYTSSRKMVETINMLAATLGATTSIYKDDREGRLGAEPNYSVLVYQLNRKKYGNVWFKKKDRLWVRIKSIEKIPNKTAYCFEVSNGEPVFTAGSTGILTHNCRLRLDKRELKVRGGGLFGSNPLTGSVGVVTLNLPRIAYEAENERDFFDILEQRMELAKESLIIKREILEQFTERGLYPYSRFYLRGIKKSEGKYWKNHFSTIGIIGMNDALLNFSGHDISQPQGRDFAVKVLEFMRGKLADYQQETGDIFNLEATPAEGTSYRLARIDRKLHPKIKIFNVEKYGKNDAEPYYTNSSQLPVGFTDDIFQALELQDPLQTKYTGGTVLHGFIGEKLPSVQATKTLVKTIAENFHLPYFTLSPTFSICPVHGYIPGEHEYCPKCDEESGKKVKCEVWSRSVGYLRPVEQWNEGKQQEFKDRKTFDRQLQTQSFGKK